MNGEIRTRVSIYPPSRAAVRLGFAMHSSCYCCVVGIDASDMMMDVDLPPGVTDIHLPGQTNLSTLCV